MFMVIVSCFWLSLLAFALSACGGGGFTEDGLFSKAKKEMGRCKVLSVDEAKNLKLPAYYCVFDGETKKLRCFTYEEGNKVHATDYLRLLHLIPKDKDLLLVVV